MFFEDEKDNLENSGSLDDLELDLDDDIDDESISWDELLKDGADDLVSVSAESPKLSVQKQEKNKEAALEAPVKIEKQKKDDTEQISDDIDLSELSGAEFDNLKDISDSKKDVFEVFGGDIQEAAQEAADGIMDDDEQDIINQLDAMELSDGLEETSEDYEKAGRQSKGASPLSGRLPVIAGIVFAAVLVLSSLVFIFAGPKNIAQNPQMTTEQASVDNSVQENPDVNLPLDTTAAQSIPVVNDKNAKDLKAEKKVTLSVESAGRSNPFLPTTAEFDKNLYSGIPAQALLPPESYGNEPDAQELMKVSVSGILFDSVKPSAIVTISGSDYFVQKGDLVDDYRVLDINRQSVVIKKGTNIYKAGVGERFSQSSKIDGSAIYQTGTYRGARMYKSVSEDYTSTSEVQVNVKPD